MLGKCLSCISPNSLFVNSTSSRTAHGIAKWLPCYKESTFKKCLYHKYFFYQLQEQKTFSKRATKHNPKSRRGITCCRSASPTPLLPLVHIFHCVSSNHHPLQIKTSSIILVKKCCRINFQTRRYWSSSLFIFLK